MNLAIYKEDLETRKKFEDTLVKLDSDSIKCNIDIEILLEMLSKIDGFEYVEIDYEAKWIEPVINGYSYLLTWRS